jgi:hypothetical protein
VSISCCLLVLQGPASFLFGKEPVDGRQMLKNPVTQQFQFPVDLSHMPQSSRILSVLSFVYLGHALSLIMAFATIAFIYKHIRQKLCIQDAENGMIVYMNNKLDNITGLAGSLQLCLISMPHDHTDFDFQKYYGPLLHNSRYLHACMHAALSTLVHK